MNNQLKKIDKIQIALFIIFGVCFILQNIFFVLETQFINENYAGVIEGSIEIPISLAGTFTSFLVLSISSLIWIVVRFITYNKRNEEFVHSQNK